MSFEKGERKSIEFSHQMHSSFFVSQTDINIILKTLFYFLFLTFLEWFQAEIAREWSKTARILNWKYFRRMFWSNVTIENFKPKQVIVLTHYIYFLIKIGWSWFSVCTFSFCNSLHSVTIWILKWVIKIMFSTMQL